MKSKLKIMAISFISILLVNVLLSSDFFWGLGIESPYLGLLFVLGLIFGPYGSLGAVLANVIIDLHDGFTLIQILPSAIFSFGVSYLAYKLWYSGFKTDKITKPKLDNVYHLFLFISCIIVCGLVYSAAHATLLGIFLDPTVDELVFVSYFLNFFNNAFICGIPIIWLSKKSKLVQTPNVSKKSVNEKLYYVLFCLLIIFSIFLTIYIIKGFNKNLMAFGLVIVGILLFAYLTKPFVHKIESNDENTLIENIMRIFLIMTLAIAIFGAIVSFFSLGYLEEINNLFIYVYVMPVLVITDVIIILFFIPGVLIIRYVENKVIKPISSFSEIEKFIKENEKIEAEGLVNVYSQYINEKNEIGTLAQSYTDLINHNNNYIENIHEIEGEKKRVEAELSIATKIQAARLPTDAIKTNEFIVNGYSQPAKEVGGDLFDYYMLDEDNLAIVIGDASGKGVPAALLAMITQVMIKQMLTNDKDPSKILSQLNDQLSENNTESMFITLWFGIYNIKTKKLTFSNAGHNPPLIKENGQFKYLNIDSGLVLGVMDGFDYITEEITLDEELVIFTDGITDANNNDGEMYGEDRLLKFFNEFKNNENPITPLLDEINSFTGDAEQFDDMTLVYLKIDD